MLCGNPEPNRNQLGTLFSPTLTNTELDTSYITENHFIFHKMAAIYV